ncbi:hypothetical protein FZC66_14200 [Priestia megaterium]|nr:hypothetical protein FZC66_14200 [Priestia megaterium]
MDLNNLTDKETKLLEKMQQGNSDIKLMISNGEESIVCVGNKMMKPRVLILCHITSAGKVCYGKIANKNIKLSYENETNVSSKGLRIFIDGRKSGKKYLYGVSNDLAITLKEDEETHEKNLIIAYVENKSIAQLTIYNSRLSSKISEIIIKRESLIGDLRNYVFTLVTTIFPSINDILQDGIDVDKNNELTEN